MSVAIAPSLRGRVHWVICELDARGEIDSHATLCLRVAIEDARARATDIVLVDLRDLTAINPAGLALFRQHTAVCCARGLELGLLICRDEHRNHVAAAFVLAGLGNQLRYTTQPDPPATDRPVRLLDHAHSVRRGRLARAAQRCSRRRTRSAPTSS